MSHPPTHIAAAWQALLDQFPEEANHLSALADALKIRDVYLLYEALTHRSALGETVNAKGGGILNSPLPWNERLEFLGDSVLGLVVATLLWKTQLRLKEGQLSKLKARLVSQPTLARLAKELGLDKCLFLGTAEKRNGGQQNPALLEDALEAVIGALYLDSSFLQTYDVVKAWFAPILEGEWDGELEIDYKSQLQELIQGAHGETPEYLTVEEAGPAHRRVFEVLVKVQGREIGRATGKTKKKASQGAAKEALRVLDLFEGGDGSLAPLELPLSLEEKKTSLEERRI